MAFSGRLGSSWLVRGAVGAGVGVGPGVGVAVGAASGVFGVGGSGAGSVVAAGV